MRQTYLFVLCTRRSFLLLCMCFIMASAFSQKKIRGTVRDVKGNPVAGVNVFIKGADSVFTTDEAGYFSIPVSGSNAIATFSLVGYVRQIQKADSDSLLSVVLKADSTLLDEVVVVGYGTQKKAAVTGAISQITGDVLLKTPSTNISSLLGGRLPGLTSLQVSGEPGDDQAALRIRGSINAVTYIVDGIPRSINDIDPNDVETVTVLKDGASAAVYGLQAAGGVIIVTTRKGKGKARISYDGTYGISQNANFPKFLDGPEFAKYYNLGDQMDQLANGVISSASEYSPIFTDANIAAMTNGDPSDGWDNVDYIKKVFGNGVNQKHNITAQGGSEKVHYFTSVGVMDQKGNIDNFTYRRYNLRFNLNAEVAKNLSLDLGAVGIVGKKHGPGYASGGTDAGSSELGWLSVAHQAILMHPYLPETYDGLYTATTQKNTSLANSPLAAIYQSGYQNTNSFDLQSNIALQYKVPFVQGLLLKVNGSYDYESSHNKNLNTPYSVYAFPIPSSTTSWGPSLMSDPRGTSNGINLGEGQYSFTHLVGQLSADYQRQFGLHGIKVLALTELRDYTDYSFAAYGKNLSFSNLPELDLATATSNPISGSNSHSRTEGFVYRLSYDYASKYLAELTGRYDGSYKFSGNVSGKRWGYFPSASLGWRLSSEGFMKQLTFLDDFKLRASVGLLGNDNVSPFSYLSQYSFDGQIVMNGALTNAIYTSSIANPNLTWEKTLSYNGGFDLGMWKGLLSVTFDAFYNYTYDMLTSMGGDYPPSMGGYYASYANYDRMSAQGFDLTVGHKNYLYLGGKRLDYSLSGNMTYATNKYLRYPDSPNSPDGQKRIGKSVDANLGWIAEGLYRSEEDINSSAWYGTRPNLGDIKYRDINGDGMIDDKDKTLIGKSNRPRLMFGMNMNFAWNGFDMDLQFTGGALFDVSLTSTYYNGNDDNTVWTQTFKENANSPLYLVKNAYSVDNPNGSFPRITIGNLTHGGDNGLASTFWLRNGNYVRLKSAQLGYTIPKKMISKIGLNGLRFFVQGSNLFTIDGLPQGIDPESPRVNNGYYPQQRTLMGGLSITF